MEDKTSIVKVFRYDPTKNEKGHYDRFGVRIAAERLTTILDVLLNIQQEQDASLAFRYACRVSMCGSCGMVINGRERLACQTVVADLKEKEITVRPLNHFPVVKDLVIDMDPFFEQYQAAMPFFEPVGETAEPAVIRPDSQERRDIGLSTECIACGCCVSSCTMMNYHETYCGPAALNRAFTLLADSRDGLKAQRMAQVLDSCYHCRTELNCTEVCPKEISPTRAIKFIQKLACLEALHRKPGKLWPETTIPKQAGQIETVQDPSRRRFLKRLTYGLGAGTAAGIGGVLASVTIGPAMRKTPAQWVRLGSMEHFKLGKVTTVNLQYQVQDGYYTSRKTIPVMIARDKEADQLIVYNSRCTHLGCTVQWDEGKRLFRCACHGGVFNLDGSVNAGPPPRPLDRYAFTVKENALFVEVV
jgi:succinate dehydrogenase / fumarate reductase iron-sulfur subunit